jgi:Zn-dependent metalloprotease
VNRRRLVGGATATLAALTVLAAAPDGGHAAAPDPTPQARAAHGAADFVAGKPTRLHLGANDHAIAGRVVSSHGLQYVPYERTYRGLPVVGGDFVVTTDSAGKVLGSSVAQTRAVQLDSIRPTIDQGQAEAAASRLVEGAQVEGSRLVVLQRDSSTLAWETTVAGTRAGRPSRLTVHVDAASGSVLATRENVLNGDGRAAWSGPNPVHLDTTLAKGSYTLTTPGATTLQCQNYTGGKVFSGTDDLWGDGDATNRETGCVDALYAAQQERAMLSTWLGRNGMDGAGGWVPIRVGLNDVNAYYDGRKVAVGHTQTGGRWIGSIDVVAHEFGHGIDHHTPGGISGGGTQEFVADTFGAATEWFDNQSAPYDVPDFTVGEQVNLVGSGPIRYMYDPKLAGDDNCYSSATATQEVHAAAGPGNHWFYLLAEGSNPGDGQPASPTCNGSSVTGVGIQKAITIMYNAMLQKTSASSYPAYRVWTLNAAKNLYPGSCTEFNAVKAAWSAVSVPAQAGEPTCS